MNVHVLVIVRQITEHLCSYSVQLCKNMDCINIAEE